jgi:hypothetical protein
MFSQLLKSLRRNQVGRTHRGRFRPIRLEIELLEARHLLSSVNFVPMPPIATGLAGSDITSAVGDVNGDGRLDVISTSSQTYMEKVGDTWTMPTRHVAVWYENNGAPVPSFTPHTIAVSNSDIPWVGVGDIDGNGTLDAIMEIDGRIYWYGNNGDGTIWTPHLVPGAQGDLSVWIADVNGDGHNDLILPYKNTITWWENVKGDGTEWTPHVISTEVSLPPPPPPPPPAPPPSSASQSTDNSSPQGSIVYAGQGQVGPSGTSTIVGALTPASSTGTGYGYDFEGSETTSQQVLKAGNANMLLADGGIDLTPQVYSVTDVALANRTGLAVSVIHGGINILSVGDINGDGKLDVISSGDGSVQWWENPGSADGTWTRHIVHQGPLWGDVRMAFAQDINGDGKLDIISSGFGDVSWWENSAGDGSTWVRHTIVSNDWNAQSITVGDINGDGHPDLFSFAPMSSGATWYENDGAANPSFTPHTISFPSGPGTVSLGDLNGDGRLDAVITPVFSNSISWFMNWDGQSPLPIVNPLPTELPPSSSNLLSASPSEPPMNDSATFVSPIVANTDSETATSAEAGPASSTVNSAPLSYVALLPNSSSLKASNLSERSGQLSIHAMGSWTPPKGLEDAVDFSSGLEAKH